MSYVWEYSKAKGGELLLLLAIADHAHDDGKGSYPSVGSLAKKTRMSERQEQRNIQALAGSGDLVVTPNQGRNGTNLYSIPMSPRQNVTPTFETGRGDISGKEGVTSVSPKSSLNHQQEPSIPIAKAIGLPPTKKPSSKKRIDPGFSISDGVRSWGEGKGFSADQMESEVEPFVDFYTGKGETRADWDASFKTWMRNRERFGSSGKKPAAKGKVDQSWKDRWRQEIEQERLAESDRAH